MDERFISEPIRPLLDGDPLEAPVPGEPILPGRFCWRDRDYRIAAILERWKGLGPCSSGSDRYVRRHWYRIQTSDGEEMKLYFERTPGPGRSGERGWWIFSVVGG